MRRGVGDVPTRGVISQPAIHANVASFAAKYMKAFQSRTKNHHTNAPAGKLGSDGAEGKSLTGPASNQSPLGSGAVVAGVPARARHVRNTNVPRAIGSDAVD